MIQVMCDRCGRIGDFTTIKEVQVRIFYDERPPKSKHFCTGPFGCLRYVMHDIAVVLDTKTEKGNPIN